LRVEGLGVRPLGDGARGDGERVAELLPQFVGELFADELLEDAGAGIPLLLQHQFAACAGAACPGGSRARLVLDYWF